MSQKKIYDVMMKATSLADAGDFLAAVEIAEELIKEFPDLVPALCFVGDMYLHIGSPVLAIEPLEKAINHKPDFYKSHYLFGCALGRTMSFQRAIQHLTIANKLKSDDTEINRNLGWIHCMMGEITKGRRFLKKAIKLDPTNSFAFNDMAVSYMIGEHKSPLKAKKWFEEAVKLNPENEYIKDTFVSFMNSK